MREEAEYLRLMRLRFPEVRARVHEGLILIPHTHLALEAMRA